MTKYIIKNCNVIYFNLDKTAICNDLMLEYPCECKERAHCLLKQVVELCKEDYTSENNVFDISKKLFAQRILDKLDIQECE